MARLQLDELDRHDIADAFKGKLYAFTPVITKHGAGLGVAVANEQGYSPVPFHMANSPYYNDMQTLANQLNTSMLGLDENTAWEIVCSTMRRGTANVKG